MKVAIVGIKGLPAKGGAERVVEAVVSRIKSKGVLLTVYVDAHYTPSDFTLEGVKLIRVPAIPGKHFRTLSLVLMSALHAVLFSKYDLVHLHNIEVSFILPILRLRYKVFSTAHGFAYSRSKWGSLAKKAMRIMDYWFIKYSDVVSSVSAKDARELKCRYAKEILYISNGVGTDFQPNFTGAEQILKKHGITPNKYFIFVAGRIEPTKGAHLAIDAINRLDGDIPLLVVGDDNQVKVYGESLHNAAGPKVFFQPLIKDTSTLFALMKNSTCLLFPSLVEAMSMVLLEAASLGTPIICSDIEENMDVLGKAGVYFKSGDSDDLLEKIKWLIEHGEQSKLNAKSLQKYIHVTYSWDKISDMYLNTYKEMVSF